MKLTLTALITLAASPALAHATHLPHSHESNGVTVAIGVIGLALVVAALRKARV